MFYVRLLLVTVFLCMQTAAHADPVRFFSALPDVPVMPDLTEDMEQTLVFDKPAGRIVQTHAYSHALAPQNVHTYYDHVLPQFGWVAGSGDAQGMFTRGPETLRITMRQDKEVLHVHIMLEPD